ncbi:MAG: glucose-6-phosphate isomerase [Planctomycetota bacterium]|nr:glucose-6-phosphate isomerase [Planctomycetota bacterium]
MDQISLDITNLFAPIVGPRAGLNEEEFKAMAEPSRQALAAVQKRRERDLRWLALPQAEGVRDEILTYADSVKGQFDNVVILGIGGSGLGMRALQTALNGPYHDLEPQAGLPRLFVLDNVDPDLIGEFLETNDPARTLFNVISKSGGTAETMSQFLIFRQQLIEAVGAEEHARHVVVTTDAERGFLREIADREGYCAFTVPDGVGGRFSVLSPVGLLPAALVGIDIEGLLKGADHMDERCRGAEFMDNPALVCAAVQYLLQTNHDLPIAVTFSYSHRLRDLADWYAQLLAESIGKRQGRDGSTVHAGPTPVRAVGVTDQHSQVQLYMEGPFDKWFTFLAVEQSDHTVTIPEAYGDIPGVGYLGGRTLNELFAAERDGTRVALTDAGRPNMTVSFPRVDAHTIGQYLYMMELAVAVMGEHYGVDAFDQPGVEAGKVAAYALMGREGFAEEKTRIEAGMPTERRTL